MKKRNISRIAITLSALFVLVCALFALSSCGVLMTDVEVVEITDARINENGELIIYFSDGSWQNVGMIENNQTDIVIEGDGESVSGATTKGLMSAVSIQSNFVSRTQTYIPGFGIVGGSGNSYYSRGSGVIYRLEGDEALIITNHHVVYDSGSRTSDGISEDIEVFLYGREDEQYSIAAEYVGGSLYYDIAVLKAKDAAFKGASVSVVSIADTEVSVGQTAIAVGNPQGYGISASLGIVSVDSEHITLSSGNITTRVIRVDTAVNAGNSGGGLYNGHGELIGIVNAKIVDESVENIGYAIPTSVAISVADNIIDNCLNSSERTVKRALLGINLGTSSASTVIDENGKIDIIETVVVAAVEYNSLAYGVLNKGDILLEASIGDESITITRTHHIIDFMLKARVGDTVTVKLQRNGETVTESFKVTEASISEY